MELREAGGTGVVLRVVMVTKFFISLDELLFCRVQHPLVSMHPLEIEERD